MRYVQICFAAVFAIALSAGQLVAGAQEMYDPKINIDNRSSETVSVRFLEDDGRVLDGPVTIAPSSTGFVTIPDVINWNTDYPLNAVLNSRKLEVTFQESGKTDSFFTTYINMGRFKDDVVIHKSHYISDASDPG